MWVNYEMLGGGVGGPVNLNQIVAIAYSLYNYIWLSYEKLSLSIEQLIMYHLQPRAMMVTALLWYKRCWKTVQMVRLICGGCA